MSAAGAATLGVLALLAAGYLGLAIRNPFGPGRSPRTDRAPRPWSGIF